MELENLKMPIKVTPYQHQEEAFKFVCERFGLTKSEGELNEQDGQSEVHTMWKDISKKRGGSP